MSHHLKRWFALLVVLVPWNPPCPGAAPGPGASAPTGAVRLTSGSTAHYAYHYNRNALTELVRSGDALIARTESGNLLRFDRATLNVTKEWFGPAAATCLGRGEGDSVLAGFSDGRIARIDPANLTVTELARVPGKVQWVGMMPGAAGAGRPAKPRVVAVVERTKWVKDDEGNRVEVPCSFVEDTALGKTYAPDVRGELPQQLSASAFLLDRKHRLWLGADYGEWGGWCSYVDLDTGQVRSVPGPRVSERRPNGFWSGVFGFTELRDGQVWAFGGITHLGITEGFLWRVDTGRAEELYRLNNGALLQREREQELKAAGIKPRMVKGDPRPDLPIPTDRPFLPITNLIEDARTGALVVISFSDVFRTDARLAHWEKIHELRIRYRGGRPDAVGTYPSIRSVLPIEQPRQAMGLLFATRLDGLILLAGGRETARTLPGLLGAEFINPIENSIEGVLFFEGSDDGRPWRLRDGTWSTVSFAPPFEKDPKEPIMQGVRSGPNWSETRVLVGRGGAIFTVNVGNLTPGTRTVARWRNGKTELLGRHTSRLDPSACFLTPDERLWHADLGTLRWFTGGLWAHSVGYEWPEEADSEEWRGIGSGLRAVNEVGPPWILHDDDNELLLRLSYGPDVKGPQLKVLLLADPGQKQRLKVRDAIPWTKGGLLLATDRGLRTVAVDGSALAAPRLNTGGRSVFRLARDGRGRLWLGGDGLAVLDADGQTLHPLDELPMLGRSKVVALAADPAHPDGAIAAIDDRGIVFVQVPLER